MDEKQSAFERFINNMPDGLTNAATTLVPVIYFGAYAVKQRPDLLTAFTSNRDHLIEFGEAVIAAAAIIAGGYHLVKHIQSRPKRNVS